MSKNIKNIFNSSRNKSVLIGIIAVAVLVGFGTCVLIYNKQKQRSETKNETKMEAVAILPMPAPAPGESYRDIPRQDTAKKEEFLKNGAALYGLPKDEPVTPKGVAHMCSLDKVAMVNSSARTTKSYRDNPAKVSADTDEVIRNCHAKYSDTDYVEPESSAKDIDPHTFLPKETSGHHQ